MARFLNRTQSRRQGSGDSVLLNLLQRMEARDDLVERLQSEYDLELLEIARNQVMQEVEPHVWESYRLCAEEDFRARTWQHG